MATPTAGRNGRLYMDLSAGGVGTAVPVPLIAVWTVDRTSDVYDGTSLGDQSQVNVPGLPKGDISLDGFLDPTDQGMVGVMGDGIQSRKVYLYTGSDRTHAYFYTTGAVSGQIVDDVNGLLKVTAKVANATSVIWFP